MSEEEKNETPPVVIKKKKRWPRILAYLLGAFFVLLIGAYFYISSASFIRGQVFSRVESILNQPVKAKEISFSPFSSIELIDFEIGDDPFLKASRVKVAYELMPMLSNQFNISELTVEDAEINVIVNRDGKLNILAKIVEEIKDEKPKDKKPKGKKNKDKQKKKEKEEEDAILLNVNNINFKNLKIHYFKDDDKQKKQMEVTLKNFSLSLPQLKSGEEFAFEIQAALESKAGTFLLKEGQLNVSGKAKISDMLKPEAVSFDIDLAGLEAVNNKVSLPLQAININTDITFDKDDININKFSIKDPRQGFKSQITLAGGVAEQGKELDLQIGVDKVDAALLDLAVPFLTGNKSFIRYQTALSNASQGKIAGFGTTIVDFSGSVKGNPEKSVNLLGELAINSLPMVKIGPQKSSIIPFNTQLSYAANFNETDQMFHINKLEFSVKEKQRQLIEMSLENPLRIDLKNMKITSEKDDEIALSMDKLDINFLKAFMKEEERSLVPKGSITIDSKLVSQDNGQSFFMVVDNFAISDAAIKQNDLYLENVSLKLSSRLGISDLASIDLQRFSFSLMQNNKTNISLQSTGKINLDDVTANINIVSLEVFPEVRKFLPAELKEKFKLANINLRSTKLNVNYLDGAIHARGNISTQNLGLGGSTFPEAFKLSQTTNFDVTLDKSDIAFEEIDLKLSTNEQDALALNFSGEVSKDILVKFDLIDVKPGAVRFVPVEMVKKFGLANINLNSKNLTCTLSDLDSPSDSLKKITLTGDFHSQGIVLGGEMFSRRVNLSQDINFDLTLGKNITLRKLDFLLSPDNEEALKLNVSGILNPATTEAQLDFKTLRIQPASRKLLPADILKKYKLKNLNLLVETLSVDYTKGKAGHIKAKLKTDDLQLGGTALKPVSLSQALDIDASIDSKELLTLKKFTLNLKPAKVKPIKVTARGEVDLTFKDPKSEIFIDLPEVVDVDALLALVKKVKNDPRTPSSKASKARRKSPKKVKLPKKEKVKTAKAETKKEPFKLTVHASVKGAIVENTLIENISMLAIVDDQKYSLKEARLQVGESLLDASAYYLDEETKSFSARLKTSGLLDLAPVNRLLNADTDKLLGGQVEIQKMTLKTQGKDDDELLKNMLASGKIFMQDLQLKNYSGNMGGFATALSVLGIQPNDMKFHTGEFDFNFKDQVLSLNKCQFTGKSLMLNPTGNIEVTDNSFDLDMDIGVGFAGNSYLQKGINSPLLPAVAQKSKSVRKFLEKYPFSEKYKMLEMKNGIGLKKIIPFKSDKKNALAQLAGLNTLTSEVLNSIMLQIAGKTLKDKEFGSAVKILSGDLSAGLGGLLEGVGRSLFERELNKRNKDKDDKKSDKKDDKEDLIKDVLGLFGKGDKKKLNDKTKKEKDRIEKEQKEKRKKEKKKQEKIDKKDELIKELNDLFK